MSQTLLTHFVIVFCFLVIRQYLNTTVNISIMVYKMEENVGQVVVTLSMVAKPQHNVVLVVITMVENIHIVEEVMLIRYIVL